MKEGKKRQQTEKYLDELEDAITLKADDGAFECVGSCQVLL